MFIKTPDTEEGELPFRWDCVTKNCDDANLQYDLCHTYLNDVVMFRWQNQSSKYDNAYQ